MFKGKGARARCGFEGDTDKGLIGFLRWASLCAYHFTHLQTRARAADACKGRQQMLFGRDPKSASSCGGQKKTKNFHCIYAVLHTRTGLVFYSCCDIS